MIRNCIRPVLRFAAACLLGCGATALQAAAPAADVASVMSRLRVEEAPTPVRTSPGWRAPRKVLLLAFGDSTWAGRMAQLQAAAPGARIVAAPDRATAVREAPEADVIVGFNPEICEPAIVDAARELRWLASLSAGIELCSRTRAASIPSLLMTNMRGVDSAAIAEHAIAMVLSLAHGLDVFAAETARGRWARGAARTTRLQQLTGKTMLVSGLGGIGTEVAWRANALGMRVVATRQGGSGKPDFVEHVGQPDELLALAKTADVIVSAVPLTAQTTNLYDARFFAQLKSTALFINVARGGSVVTDELVKALEEGRLGGAGLDVTEPEPLPEGHALWRAPRVLITPHISSLSDLPGEERWTLAAENLRRYVAGERMLLVVDPRRGY
jgi:phosphoglycerate dehydrogenase-like enzyme